MALFSLVGYFISDMKKDIDGKLNKSEYEIRMANVERQLQRLWERGRNQGTP